MIGSAVATYDDIDCKNVVPGFLSVVRGELFKISRQLIIWVMLFFLIGGTALAAFLPLVAGERLWNEMKAQPLTLFYGESILTLAIARVFVGIFLLILTSYVIGQEYQLGTIRILLARGVGRVRLLMAKVSAIALIALGVFVCILLLNFVITCFVASMITGNPGVLNVLDSAFWSTTGIYALTVLISMSVTILVATACNAVTRSLVIGLSASLSWFPADNMLNLILQILASATGNKFWLVPSTYLLGPNLNSMAAILEPGSTPLKVALGAPLLMNVSPSHTLLVALAYGLALGAVAVIVTQLRDVKE
ncbi:hypothetical protein EPA93_30055 [Ktedonosporobacter rubrisoli]|uniref:ABC transporter permease n=1 Tax=Ktedonosporobacter rubrisoli TaxID=2509675 RepID=A0A4P6JWD0_KTERU|nr:ABC transporter permease [Ktedonosporobacter rubrisoli]QBD79998.1 hypothetical protein EPA93_30055 [Ktedonosporobacter rubrisoli]